MNNIGLFIGTERGFQVLKTLINNKYKVSNVLILEQQKHELDNYTNLIISFCKKNNVKYSTSKKIKPKDYKRYISKTKSDVVFVISWRYLISKECFNIPKLGIYVLHDSLLPQYRGFSPTNWVIINGEKQTGLTLQRISEHTDAGEIIDQVIIKLRKNETATSLNNKFLILYPKIVLKNINKILRNDFKVKKQNEKKATYGSKRTPEDGKINFNDSLIKIDNLIKGLSYPYPGAFCFYKGQKIIIWEAEKPKTFPNYIGKINGKIISITDDYVDVLVKNGVLRIKSVSKYSSPSKFQKPNTLLNSLGVNLK